MVEIMNWVTIVCLVGAGGCIGWAIKSHKTKCELRELQEEMDRAYNTKLAKCMNDQPESRLEARDLRQSRDYLVERVHELEAGIGLTVRRLVEEAHKNAVRHMFWEDIDYIQRQDEGIGHAMNNAICTRLLLIVSEATEAMDALRSGAEDNFGEELADIVIRVADLAGGMGIDLEAEIAAKMRTNKNRPPKHGKQF